MYAYKCYVNCAYKKAKSDVGWSDQCVRISVSVLAYTGNRRYMRMSLRKLCVKQGVIYGGWISMCVCVSFHSYADKYK